MGLKGDTEMNCGAQQLEELLMSWTVRQITAWQGLGRVHAPLLEIDSISGALRRSQADLAESGSLLIGARRKGEGSVVQTLALAVFPAGGGEVGGGRDIYH